MSTGFTRRWPSARVPRFSTPVEAKSPPNGESKRKAEIYCNRPAPTRDRTAGRQVSRVGCATLLARVASARRGFARLFQNLAIICHPEQRAQRLPILLTVFSMLDHVDDAIDLDDHVTWLRISGPGLCSVVNIQLPTRSRMPPLATGNLTLSTGDPDNEDGIAHSVIVEFELYAVPTHLRRNRQPYPAGPALKQKGRERIPALSDFGDS